MPGCQEEKEFATFRKKEDLPKTLAGFKNHHLFVLKRQLLKYQVSLRCPNFYRVMLIQVAYPTDVQPAGYFKEEPVYYRTDVYTVHNKERWIQLGMNVKEDGEPFKSALMYLS